MAQHPPSPALSITEEREPGLQHGEGALNYNYLQVSAVSLSPGFDWERMRV